MGGAVGGGFTNAPMGSLEGEGTERFGNWTPWAEFNIYIDPESAQSVFSNPVLAAKTTIAPLDLTHQMVSVRARSYRALPANDYNSWQHQRYVWSCSMGLTQKWMMAQKLRSSAFCSTKSSPSSQRHMPTSLDSQKGLRYTIPWPSPWLYSPTSLTIRAAKDSRSRLLLMANTASMRLLEQHLSADALF